MKASTMPDEIRAKCDAIYQSVVALTEGSDQSLFELAQCFIDGYDPNKLRSLLISDDEGLVIDGLFVLSEIGDLARNYMAELGKLTQHSDTEIRHRAITLAETYR